MKENKPIIIYLSFKNDLEDVFLFNFIAKHSNKSGFIKDILRKAMKEELTKDT
jgi:hypothetical protein